MDNKDLLFFILQIFINQFWTSNQLLSSVSIKQLLNQSNREIPLNSLSPGDNSQLYGGSWNWDGRNTLPLPRALLWLNKSTSCRWPSCLKHIPHHLNKIEEWRKFYRLNWSIKTIAHKKITTTRNGFNFFTYLVILYKLDLIHQLYTILKQDVSNKYIFSIQTASY